MVSALLAERAVWDALVHVTDPEIPVVNIVEMGMVRGVEIEGGRATVKFTPTFSGCPALHVIRQDIERAVARWGLQPSAWKRSSARRGAPTTSPRPPAPSWSSTASRRRIRLARATPS